MKQFQKNWMVILMVAIMSVGFVSCSKDDTPKVSGLYYYDAGGGSRTAYNFINSNTVEVYGVMTTDPSDTWRGERGVKFPLRDGWYYWEGNKHTYNYYIEEDVVVVDYDRIMQIDGENLYYFDLNVVLHKWN